MRRQMVFARVYPPRPLEAAALEALLVRLASDPTHTEAAFEAHSVPATSGIPAKLVLTSFEPCLATQSP